VRTRPLRRGALVALALAATGCAGKNVDLAVLSSPNDRVVWEAGDKAFKKREWASARQYFKRIVDAFPQSEHQPDARIAVADAYFEEGGTASYVLAVSSYHEFLTLYPQHARSDYAQFRAAESYFKQLNSADRDQTHTKKALEEYEKLLDIYPQSRYIEQTRARIKECRQTLGRAHYLVAYFYQRGRQAWRSAIGRYETILNEYPDYDGLDEVIYRYAECLAASGRYAEARPQLARLEKEFPQSQYVGSASKLRSTFPPTATPAAPLTPGTSDQPGAPAGRAGQAVPKPPTPAPAVPAGTTVVPSTPEKPAPPPPPPSV
jgi:outer membrane assembly lipoprotein YfiO